MNSLRVYWDTGGHLLEGAATTTAMLENPHAAATARQTPALCTAAEFLEGLGDLDRAGGYAEQPMD